jgi:hypothetical protein
MAVRFDALDHTVNGLLAFKCRDTAAGMLEAFAGTCRRLYLPKCLEVLRIESTGYQARVGTECTGYRGIGWGR